MIIIVEDQRVLDMCFHVWGFVGIDSVACWPQWRILEVYEYT